MNPVEEAKKNYTLFISELGIEFKGWNRNYKCPFHESDGSNPSMTIFIGKDGDYVWNCRGACSRSGTVLDAMALRQGRDVRDIVRQLMRGEYRPAPSRPAPKRDAEVKVPVVDRQEVDEFVKLSHQSLLANFDYIDKTFHRGISLAVASDFKLGFLLKYQFSSHSYPTHNFWTIPIPGPDGSICAVKAHKENPKHGRKSGWAPFGRENRQAYFDFIPSPEYWRPQLRLSDDLFLCPGELKAFASASAGLPSTAYSGGESFNWTEQMAARFSGLNVVVIYDDDYDVVDKFGKTQNAGRAFRNRALAALYPHARKLKSITLGRLEDYGLLIMEKLHET